MYLKKCRCGKSQKNFKMDIGPFFVNKCCKEKKVEAPVKEPKIEEPKVQEEVPVVVETPEVVEEVKPKPTRKKRGRKAKKS